MNIFRWANILVNELLIVQCGLTLINIIIIIIVQCPHGLSRVNDERRQCTMRPKSGDYFENGYRYMQQHSQPVRGKHNMKGAQSTLAFTLSDFVPILPLGVARSTFVPEHVHKFAVKTLEDIGNTTGIRTALNTASTTKTLYFEWQNEGKSQEWLGGRKSFTKRENTIAGRGEGAGK